MHAIASRPPMHMAPPSRRAPFSSFASFAFVPVVDMHRANREALVTRATFAAAQRVMLLANDGAARPTTDEIVTQWVNALVLIGHASRNEPFPGDALALRDAFRKAGALDRDKLFRLAYARRVHARAVAAWTVAS